MAKNFISVEKLSSEVSESIGLFSKILSNLKTASQKIVAQITERDAEIDKLQKEKQTLEELNAKSVSITEKIEAFLN